MVLEDLKNRPDSVKEGLSYSTLKAHPVVLTAVCGLRDSSRKILHHLGGRPVRLISTVLGAIA
jgi:hypothetical protein